MADGTDVDDADAKCSSKSDSDAHRVNGHLLSEEDGEEDEDDDVVLEDDEDEDGAGMLRFKPVGRKNSYPELEGIVSNKRLVVLGICLYFF